MRRTGNCIKCARKLKLPFAVASSRAAFAYSAAMRSRCVLLPPLLFSSLLFASLLFSSLHFSRSVLSRATAQVLSTRIQPEPRTFAASKCGLRNFKFEPLPLDRRPCTASLSTACVTRPGQGPSVRLLTRMSPYAALAVLCYCANTCCSNGSLVL